MTVNRGNGKRAALAQCSQAIYFRYELFIRSRTTQLQEQWTVLTRYTIGRTDATAADFGCGLRRGNNSSLLLELLCRFSQIQDLVTTLDVLGRSVR